MDPGSSSLRADLLDAAVDLMGRSGRGGTVKVRGDSMRPTLHPGQLLAVEFAPRHLSRGDMLLFRQADYLVVHRLLGRAKAPDGRPCLRTRGDGVLKLDPAVLPDKVVGRVLAFDDEGRWRSVRGAAARFYGWMLAWHDLFWAATGVGAHLAERASGKLRMRVPFRRPVAAMDRLMLRLAHAMIFRSVHPVVPRPDEAGGDDAPAGRTS